MSFNDAMSDSDLTTEEFKTGFKSLKGNKAAGIDTVNSNIFWILHISKIFNFNI